MDLDPFRRYGFWVIFGGILMVFLFGVWAGWMIGFYGR